MTIPENKKKHPLLKDYEGRSELEKLLMQIVTVQIYGLRITHLMNCVNELGFRDEAGYAFRINTFRTICQPLEKAGLIHRTLQGYTCPEAIWRDVLQDVLVLDRFEGIAACLLKADPLPPGYRYYFRTTQEVLRALLMAIYAKAFKVDLDQVYTTGMRGFPVEFSRKPPLLSLFNQPFQPGPLEALPIAIQLNLLKYLLDEADRVMASAEALVDYVVTHLPALSDRAIADVRNSVDPGRVQFTRDMVRTICERVSRALLLRGATERQARLLDAFADGNNPAYGALRGWAELLGNSTDAAIRHFNAALKHLKKQAGKRIIFFPGYEGFFYLVALLKSEQPEHHAEALKHIEAVAKNSSDYLCHAPLEAMEVLFLERLALPAVSTQSRHISSLKKAIQNDRPTVKFFSMLVMSWLDKAKAKACITELKQIRRQAAAAGLEWLEAESIALLAALGEKGQTHQKEAERLHSRLQTLSLVELVTPRPKWEQALRALIHIGENSASPASGLATDARAHAEQRLIWLLDYDEKHSACSITPRLQKRTKNGQWTKGRPVALKTLRASYTNMEGLTEQDRRVCSTIVEEVFYGSYRYGNVEYSFEEKKAFEALVGHPLLFLEDALISPVELVKGEPELWLQARDGSTHLAMHPMPDAGDEGVRVLRETPSRLKLISFTPVHYQIAETLGRNGLKLPAKAQDMAGRAAAALAALMPVNSDLALNIDAKAPIQERTADPTPHAHVTPWQDGIKIEFLVRPFAQAGSFFKPGRGAPNVLAEIDGGKAQTTRDLALETAQMQAVIDACPTLTRLEPVEGEWLLGDPEDALELLFELKNCGDMLIMEWPQGESIRVRGQASFNQFSLSIEKDRDWFKATGALLLDDNLALDLAQLMALLEKPCGRFVTLDDGTFLALTRALKDRLEELRAYTSPHGKGLRFAPLAASAMEDLTDQVGSLKSDKAWKEHCKKLKELIQPEVPGTLRAQLRPYQVDGFKWLAQLAHWQVGACLADDMGLGKTVQALAAILLYADQGPTLVVAPLSVMANWQDECRKFAPTLTPQVFGPGDRQAFLNSLQPFDLVISSYGLLQTEAEKLAQVSWQTVVLDEAQAIKNRQTKRSQAVMTLNARFRLATTGTPVENHLEELWTLFQFLNPGLLGNLSHFRSNFALPIEQNQNREASRRLKKLIRPFILRRLKSDVLQDLPAKTEIVLRVEMSPEEALLYEATRRKALENIEGAGDAPGPKHLRILAELMRLRRLCCHPSLVLPEAGLASSKHRVFADVVTDLLENNHKALVFSQFVGHLALLRTLLDERGITYQYLDGATSATERKKRIQAFQGGAGDLFLISLKAGGLGLNLTAADYVIHMDPWWNPAVEDQASDRAHRIGQTRPVTVYRLVVKDTIEEQIVKLHHEKRELAETLLEGSEAAGKMSAEELLALLR